MCLLWNNIAGQNHTIRAAVILWMMLMPGYSIYSQNGQGYKWWSPYKDTLAVLPSGESPYLVFTTNATDITIRYPVTEKARLLPAGMMGIDLYVICHNGEWKEVTGRPDFGDTIVYRFNKLDPDPAYRGRTLEFRLFLPLGTSAKPIQVGVPDSAIFAPQPAQPERPIVLLGPSVSHTNDISGPGRTWTAILSRKLDRAIIQVTKSSQSSPPGKQTKQQSFRAAPALYLLDGRLWAGENDGNRFRRTLSTAIATLQRAHPGVPILLLRQNAANITGSLRRKQAETTNHLTQEVFARLTSTGTKQLFLLTVTDTRSGTPPDDGVSPANNAAAQQYAAACENTIRTILHEEQGQLSTTRPVVQSRDGWYNWRKRHAELLALNKSKPPVNVIFANSIVHFWGGEPINPSSRGEDSWNRWLAPLGLRNMGFGWDRIENVLWRIHHDELVGFTAKHVVLMIGTNNLGGDSDSAIIAGLSALIAAVQQRQPAARILLSGIFPRRNMEIRVGQINRLVQQLAVTKGAVFINPGRLLLDQQGRIDESLFSDGLHPNASGYQRIAPELAASLQR